MDEPIREVEIRMVCGYQHLTIVEESNATIAHMVAEGWQMYSPPMLSTVHDGENDFFQTILLTFRRDTVRESS